MRNFDIAGGIVNRGRGTFSEFTQSDSGRPSNYCCTNKSSEKDNHAQ